VHAEDLLVNNGCNGKTVEAVSEGLPQFDVVAAFALVVETIDTIDRCAFVVSSEQEEILRILDFVCEEEADSLEGLLSTINVIAKEEIVGIGWEATVLKESEEVIVLAVDVTADFNGGLKLQQNRLVNENVSCLDAKATHFLLSEVYLLSWATPRV
jgi:hypothetical protein